MKRMRVTLLCAALTAFAAIHAGAQTVKPQEVTDERLREGIRLHDAARDDPEANVAKGKEILSALQESSPLAKGYYGSIVTLEASLYARKKNGIKALALLGEGTKLIDKAVSFAPDLVDLRFLRMENSYEVSQGSPLNRYKAMKEDIDWLDGRKASLDPEWRGTLELYRGLYLAKARKIDEALAAFAECVALSPGSSEAELAKKQIARYSE